MGWKYATEEEARAAKAAWTRAWRSRMKEMGVNYHHIEEGYVIDEPRHERMSRQKVAKACATPYRDANAHVRGGSFKHDPGVADSTARTATDFMTGDKTSYRGTGFYAGRRTNNG